MVLETTIWDPAENLNGPEDELAYLQAALEDGNPQLVAAAIGDIARARGMSDTARKAGLSRETIYKAFSPDGNPKLTTILIVLKALGIGLQAVPASGLAQAARAGS